MEESKAVAPGLSSEEKRRRLIVFVSSMAVLLASAAAFMLGARGYDVSVYGPPVIIGLAVFLPSLAFPRIPKWQIALLWASVTLLGEGSAMLSEATGNPLWWAAAMYASDLMCAGGAGVGHR